MAENWRPFPLPDGTYSDPTRAWTHQDVVNWLPVAAEAQGTRSATKYRTAPGLTFFARCGAGPIRGMRDVEGSLYVVAGTQLYSVRPDGEVLIIEGGTVPGTGLVQMTHNQVTGGNQLVIATGSSGYIYDTRDDSLLTPAEPVDPDPGAEPTLPGGGTPSTGLGPNGGYPDDDEPAIPLPTTFGSNLIPVGDFSDPGDLDDWADRNGDALTGWTIAAGAAHYSGATTSYALYYPAQYRMKPYPFPRYSVEVTADISCDATAKVAVGMIVGYSSADNLPQILYTSTPTEYLVSTPVTHTFDFKTADALVSERNEWIYPTATPVMYVQTDSGATIDADFDNVTMEVTEVSVPVTTQTLTNLDFSDGLNGWTVFPSGVGTIMPRVSGGELILDSSTASARYCLVANDDPIDLADELNKYVHIECEAWCNDPTLLAGVPEGGVALGLIYRSPDGVYAWQGSKGPYERGDWTARETWWRQQQPTANLTAGWTVHLLIGLRARMGYAAKVRNLSLEVTDSAVTS